MSTDDLEYAEPDPRRDDPKWSYGILDEASKPSDILYRLDYDSERGFLKLNTFVIQRFHWEGFPDKVFSALFSNGEIVKEIELDESEDANVIINNIKMPLALRRALFRTSENGRKLQVMTVISRERAKKFSVNNDKVQDYIAKRRDVFYKSEKH